MSFVRNRNKTGLDPLADETPGHTSAKNGWATEIRNAEYVGDIMEKRLYNGNISIDVFSNSSLQR